MTTKKCEICGHDPTESTSIETMSDEEKRAAEVFFPYDTTEEAHRKFLFHRTGSQTDHNPNETEKTLEYFPHWLSPSTPVYGDFPGEWYGTLWWKGRDTGASDPTMPIKQTWYARWYTTLKGLVYK